MVPSAAEPRILFMSSGASAPSPTPKHRSRSRGEDGRPRITQPDRVPKVTTSPLAAGRAVHRRVPLPSDPNDIEVRALRGQQKIDHDVIDQLNENLVKITFMMSEQCEVVEMQRKWNEENLRRVLAMEGAIKEAVGEANKYTEDKLNSRICWWTS